MELIESLATRTLSSKTINNYEKTYKAIINRLGRPMIEAEQDEIINAISKVSENPSTRYTYSNVPMIVLKHHNKPFDLIEKSREELDKKRRQHHQDETKTEISQLPKLSEMKYFISTLVEKEDYKGFIINYLLYHYGCRLKDLNCKVIDGKEFHASIPYNTLAIYDNHVKWTRNDYKTLVNYGSKTHLIRNKDFKFCIKQLPLGKWLLNGGDEPLGDDSLNKAIKKHTFRNLSEGNIFKMIIADLKDKPNFDKKLLKYSERRGTDVKTILTAYNNLETDDVESE
jgi:hypothetical protein